MIRRKRRCWHPSHVTWSRDFTHLTLPTVYATTVVSSEVGHVTIFQRSGTCVCGEGNSRTFGPKATSAVMLSQWENGALLFVWILTIKRFVLFQRYNMIPKVQSILYTSQSYSLRKHESLSCENRCK